MVVNGASSILVTNQITVNLFKANLKLYFELYFMFLAVGIHTITHPVLGSSRP